MRDGMATKSRLHLLRRICNDHPSQFRHIQNSVSKFKEQNIGATTFANPSLFYYATENLSQNCACDSSMATDDICCILLQCDHLQQICDGTCRRHLTVFDSVLNSSNNDFSTFLLTFILHNSMKNHKKLLISEHTKK